jgi:sphinganine-1-phosphate aldolase
MHQLSSVLARLPKPVIRSAERALDKIPGARRRIEGLYGEIVQGLDESVHPYKHTLPAMKRLPVAGRPRSVILAEMEELQAHESVRWRSGYVSGAVYQGDPDHVAFLNQVYAINAQSNPLHFDLWPSTVKYEAEIVSMTAHMLGADRSSEAIVGTVTSGGTESILLATRTYRDWARIRHGVKQPELVVPTTAHAAFDKAAQSFGIRLVRVPVGSDFRADVARMAAAINRNTIALVGSAPSFPHGAIDPIAELATLAESRGIGLHVDACLGGFVLPWAERLGYAVPAFDFRLKGVTSMSADTHKYGYAAKGTSVILYRGEERRRLQYYAVADWPGGLYFSPTLAGSRPGGLSAACWAAMISLGEQGYLQATAAILATAQLIRRWIEVTPDLVILGDPLFVIAFASPALNIYQVLEYMTQRGWSLNGLHHPPAIHLCVTLRHTQPGVAQRFMDDLRAAVELARLHPNKEDGMAPVYGMAATMPMHGLVNDLLKRVLDLLYRVE